MSLTSDDVTRLRGLGDPLDMKEIEDVYLPISRLLNYYVGAIGGLHDVTSEFLGEQPPRTPFVIGVAGSVAVGKSTTSRILRELLEHWPDGEWTPGLDTGLAVQGVCEAIERAAAQRRWVDVAEVTTSAPA